jgi:metal-responsive CopG/Arc/MetJ family transcriptional regulator
MAKMRTTVTLDEDLYRAVKVRAARTGKRESQVIEDVLRRDFDWLDDVWSRVKNRLSEEEAMELAVTELHAMREEERASGRP